MKKTVKIPAILLSKEDAAFLKLKNEYYIVLIPRNLATNSGIKETSFDFDLISKNNSLSLGTSLPADQEATVMINDM
jgi:hypothetical protein